MRTTAPRALTLLDVGALNQAQYTDDQKQRHSLVRRWEQAGEHLGLEV